MGVLASISILLVWLLLSFIMVFMVIRGKGVVRGGVILLCCMQSFLDTGCWYNFFFFFYLFWFFPFSLFFLFSVLASSFLSLFFLIIIVFFHAVIDSFTLFFNVLQSHFFQIFFQFSLIFFPSFILSIFPNLPHVSFLHFLLLFLPLLFILTLPSFPFIYFMQKVNYSLWFFPSFLFIFLSFTSITQMFFPHT